MTKDALNERATQAIIEADEDEVIAILDEAEKEGIATADLLKEGFSKGMDILGEQFADGDVFLPELIMAAEVMAIVTDKLEEEVAAGGADVEKKGVIVLGTVKDDVHDIGKTICGAMLKASGYEVHDVGKQVPPEVFIEKAKEYNADIIGSSALLTTTMEHQKTIEELLKEAGLKGKVKTMVGGAPVTNDWAKGIGADGYSKDASECCTKAAELITN